MSPDSRVNGSTASTTQNRGKPRVLFVGYIEDLHYVSTVPHTLNVNVLKYLKTKFSETEDKHQKRLERKRLQYAKTKTTKKPCTLNSKPKPTANNLHAQNNNTIPFANKSHAKNSGITATIIEPHAQYKHNVLEKNDYLASFDMQSNGSIVMKVWYSGINLLGVDIFISCFL